MSVKMLTFPNREQKPIEQGQKYGRLTVIQWDSKRKKWHCLCECGTYSFVLPDNLKSGNTKSCGCLMRETRKTANTKHGKTDTKIYSVWKGMRQRCFNPHNKSYKYYGGRGITVCEEWKNSFETFYKWSIENGYQEGLQIDRIDNEGMYEPSNCAWVTAKQNNNHRRLKRNKYGQYASI